MILAPTGAPFRRANLRIPFMSAFCFGDCESRFIRSELPRKLTKILVGCFSFCIGLSRIWWAALESDQALLSYQESVLPLNQQPMNANFQNVRYVASTACVIRKAPATAGQRPNIRNYTMKLGGGGRLMQFCSHVVQHFLSAKAEIGRERIANCSHR